MTERRKLAALLAEAVRDNEISQADADQVLASFDIILAHAEAAEREAQRAEARYNMLVAETDDLPQG